MTGHDNIRSLLARLFAEQRLAVLATENEGKPHTSLMAFTAAEDLKSLIIATRCDTKKHFNLRGNAQVSLLVDNRTEGLKDPRDALAVTVIGKAELQEGTNRKIASDLFLRAHPESISLTTEPDGAVWLIRVIAYQVVKGLNDVQVWRLEEDLRETAKD
jgi:general stress protein 26